MPSFEKVFFGALNQNVEHGEVSGFMCTCPAECLGQVGSKILALARVLSEAELADGFRLDCAGQH